MRHIEILDSTLRDGAQSESISFSVADKKAIAQLLYSLGIEFIEAGNPASNPKDAEFFINSVSMPFADALTSFGATRHSGCSCAEDASLSSLSSSGALYTSVFGKAAKSHVTDILSVTPDENLSMITESCAFLSNTGKQVFFDAEHFFDGYKEDKNYALACLDSAVQGGASRLILCDTAGGSFPNQSMTQPKRYAKNSPM